MILSRLYCGVVPSLNENEDKAEFHGQAVGKICFSSGSKLETQQVYELKCNFVGPLGMRFGGTHPTIDDVASA